MDEGLITLDKFLGKQAKDIVTGFEGIVTSKHIYLTGCTQYGLQPRIDKDGKIPDKAYFDETRLVFMGEGVNIGLGEPGCDTREHP